MSIDETELPSLTRRQEEILGLIIRAYSQTPEPVSSKSLVDSFVLHVSSATIRNEMMVLEELGFIAAPHTSAGRVPTESGYRYFVQNLLNSSDLSSDDVSRINQRLQNAPIATEAWMNAVATALSRATQTAALVTPPAAETSRFKHLELISIQGRLVLMVLVLNQGAVVQQMLSLAEPVPQQRLSECANSINAICPDATANEVRLRCAQLPLLEREIAELCRDIMSRQASEPARMVYRDGLSDLITSFNHSRGAQQAVRVVEEREFLSGILNEVLFSKNRDVQVVIAGNGRWEELSHLTMILSRYGIPGQTSGAVGVVGPTNLNYDRAISAVNYISGIMSAMLTTAMDVRPSESQPDTPGESNPSQD